MDAACSINDDNGGAGWCGIVFDRSGLFGFSNTEAAVNVTAAFVGLPVLMEEALKEAKEDSEVVQRIIEYLLKAVSAGNQNPKEPKQDKNNHHIVLKEKQRLQEFKEKYEFDVNNPLNQIEIPTKTHWYMHTKEYMYLVPKVIEEFYQERGDMNQALEKLRMIYEIVNSPVVP